MLIVNGGAKRMTRATELLASLPKEYRVSPNLTFSPPVQTIQPPPLSSPVGPRPSIGDFLPSPGPGAFRPDGSIGSNAQLGIKATTPTTATTTGSASPALEIKANPPKPATVSNEAIAKRLGAGRF